MSIAFASVIISCIPGALDGLPVEMAWHVRYRHDPAHRWLRALIGEVITDFKDKPAATAMTSPT
ncbi:hypothetical protein [Tsuneonella suprasediminis]|uniref:hypothetical protein n=1 Tax=Tsuneonella suprasediminis TaxID=2306996 RepID=UPI001F0CC596|nr:hypothetical protein [Tsuneonella suprasediminis]